MTNWIEVGHIKPPVSRPLIVYCPEFSDAGYVIAEWNGLKFTCETHDDEVDKYVDKWAIFMEAD